LALGFYKQVWISQENDRLGHFFSFLHCNPCPTRLIVSARRIVTIATLRAGFQIVPVTIAMKLKRRLARESARGVGPTYLKHFLGEV
jgi:hypothetical protein